MDVIADSTKGEAFEILEDIIQITCAGEKFEHISFEIGGLLRLGCFYQHSPGTVEITNEMNSITQGCGADGIGEGELEVRTPAITKAEGAVRYVGVGVAGDVQIAIGIEDKGWSCQLLDIIAGGLWRGGHRRVEVGDHGYPAAVGELHIIGQDDLWPR